MLFNRKVLKNIISWLPEKEIIILNGARQVGKTSLLKLVKKELLNQNIAENQIFYLNLEELKALNDINNDPENLLTYIIEKDKKAYFLIDEIQYLDNPTNFLKHIYDKYADKVKLIVTGSSSLELKAKIQDSLAGRKASFLIEPLCFEEYLKFIDFKYFDYLYKKEIPAEIKAEFDRALDSYLIYGGMPAVVLQENNAKKEILLNEYINTYINKDIRYIGNIKNITSFNNFVKILSAQIGNLLNINELCNTASISRREAVQYLDLLKFTFVLDEIHPFKSNIRSQLTKMPKTYFFDLGIRNAIMGNFLNLDNRVDAGALFENFTYLELKNNFQNIFFFRTVNKAEIDFVIENKGAVIPVAIKYQFLKKQIDERVLKNFIKNNQKTKNSFIVNLVLNKKSNGINYIDYRFIKKI